MGRQSVRGEADGMGGAARGGTMDEVFFAVKRAFHASLRVTRRALAALGLTAARFDLLLALYEGEEDGTKQRELVRDLGVSASVVSRMLKALEGLGLVSRWSDCCDRRRRWVMLTAEGLSRVRLLEWRCMRSGQAKLAVDSALAGKRWYSPAACAAATKSALDMLWGMRGAWGDTSRRYVRWRLGGIAW